MTRETLEATNEVNRLVVECAFRQRAVRGRKSGLKAGSSGQDQQDSVGGRMKKPPGSKRKRNDVPMSEEGAVGLSDDQIEVEVDVRRLRPVPVLSQALCREFISTDDDEEDSDFIDDGDGWSRSVRPTAKRPLPPTRKKRRSSPGLGSSGGFMGRVITENDQEVMVLSSD